MYILCYYKDRMNGNLFSVARFINVDRLEQIHQSHVQVTATQIVGSEIHWGDIAAATIITPDMWDLAIDHGVTSTWYENLKPYHKYRLHLRGSGVYMYDTHLAILLDCVIGDDTDYKVEKLTFDQYNYLIREKVIESRGDWDGKTYRDVE